MKEANEDDYGANEAKKFLELFDKNFYRRVGSQSLKAKLDKHAKKQQIAIGGRNVFCTGTKYVPWAYSSIIPKKKMMPTKFKIKTVMAHAKKL